MKTKSRTSLVLMELIITILLFSFCSAVCVQLFVQSHILAQQTKELNFALASSQSFAEVMRGSDGSIESIMNFYPNAASDGYSYIQVYYDKDFNEINPSDNSSEAVYIADIKIEKVFDFQNMNINIAKLENYETIYSLDVSKYIKESEVSKDE